MVQKMPAKLGRVALVIEMDVDREARHQWVRLTTSIPGREGTFSRVWELPDGTFTDRQAEDVTAWIAKSIIDASQVLGGVQTTLP